MKKSQYFVSKYILLGMLSLISFNVQAQKSYKEFYNNFKPKDSVGIFFMKSRNTENFDSIVLYTQNAIKLANKNTNDFLKFGTYYKLSYALLRKQDYQKASIAIDSCIYLGIKNNLRKQLVDAYRVKGVIRNNQQLYDDAITNYQTAISYADDIEDKISLNTNLSAIYIDTNKLDLALIYINELIDYNTQYPGLIDSHMLTYNYLNLSIVAPTYKEKINASDKAIALAEQTKDKDLIFIVLDNKAQLLVEEKKYNEAIMEYMNVLNYARKNKNIEILQNTFLNLSDLFYKLKSYNISLNYLDSINKFSKNEFVPKMINFRKDTLLLYNYLKIKNYEKASIYALKYIDFLKKEKANIKEAAYIAYGKKYQTEKIIKENELLIKENRIKNLKIYNQNITRNYLILGSVLGLITLVITYNRFRLKRATASSLAKQNDIINIQKVELEKSNANKQRLFGIIAHDLVNPFNAILGYTNILEEDYESFSETERKKIISVINRYATSNYKLTRTLLDWVKLQQERLVVNKAQLNCKDLVINAIKPYQVLANKKQIKVNTSIPEDTFIEADKNMMQTVIGNLFVNAIKFTPRQGEIYFLLVKNKKGAVNIEIIDNGVGMSQEQLKNLFDITKASSFIGTENEKGNGLGLILCEELMELQGGSLQLISQKNRGTKAIVTIE